MKSKRYSLSLTGLPSLLLAIAGLNEDSLSTCEQYSVILNQWSETPSLKTARQWPGSILLPSMRAFCFCGLPETDETKPIESYQLKCDTEWKSLIFNEKITQAAQLVGVSFRNKILAFGGRKYNHSMFYLSEEGELEEYCSENASIPQYMCMGSFTVKEGNI